MADFSGKKPIQLTPRHSDRQGNHQIRPRLIMGVIRHQPLHAVESSLALYAEKQWHMAFHIRQNESGRTMRVEAPDRSFGEEAMTRIFERRGLSSARYSRCLHNDLC